MRLDPFRILALAGRHGCLVLLSGVLLGLASPTLATAARPLMGLAVFVFTLGALLRVERAQLLVALQGRRTAAAALAWCAFGVPLAAALALALLDPAPALRDGLLLAFASPPAGSAAALAALLGLDVPLALVVSLVTTLLAPIYLPPLAFALTGASLAIDPVALGLRLLVIVGGALALAGVLRWRASAWLERRPDAMTGVAALGLVVVAIGSMHGITAQVEADPVRAAGFLGAAFAANLAAQAAVTLSFAVLGRTRAATIGLLSGQRNITLVWSAVPSLAARPEVELVLASAVVAFFVMPAVLRSAGSVWSAQRRRAALALARLPAG